NLPEKSAKAMRLFISGHKYIEISVIMQIPIGTVKTRINKSREKLKKDLKDYLN
ncbi:MAG: RNA polymerase sigma factor, partial [Bacteroidaceae bacterium]|nr:RNA polymerase sigma factor [Bacteroidaceae bacterium]